MVLCATSSQNDAREKELFGTCKWRWVVVVVPPDEARAVTEWRHSCGSGSTNKVGRYTWDSISRLMRVPS